MFYRAPKHIGLLESVFRAIVNRWRVYRPLAGLPAVFLVRRFCGRLEGLPAVFVAGWSAGHLMAGSFTGRRIHGLRHAPSPTSYFIFAQVQ
ncbi:MAG: hypothetical protein DRG66_08000 [Deltaproteobacteria bacterium]|nr:MAG: hypothetical protein DRG66_08000 [Deltaproteobacteria bacterium]